MNLSPLQKVRYEYSPKLPTTLRGGISRISVKVGAPTESVADQDKPSFPTPTATTKSPSKRAATTPLRRSRWSA